MDVFAADMRVRLYNVGMTVHLHVRSCYTLLKSTVRIPDIVKRAKEYGMSYAALTDRNVMHGAAEFLSLCKEAGIRPIIGMETDCLYHDETVPFLLLAKDNIGYLDLVRLSCVMNIEHRPCNVEELKQATGHCFLIVYGEGGWCDSELMHDDANGLREKLGMMQKELGVFDIALSYQDSSLWHNRNSMLKQIARTMRIPTVALNKIYYTDEQDWRALREAEALAENRHLSDKSLTPLKGRYFRSVEEMAKLYEQEELLRTDEIASQCTADGIPFKTSLPVYPVPEGFTAGQYLTGLCNAGLKKRCHGEVTDAYAGRLQYELSVIIRMHFEDYFLIVYDYILYAKKHGIRVGPGRGSAAGSLAAYCLGITEVDPLRYGLLFERFLNPERVSMPDIDTDFPDDRRSEVIAYVRGKYGAEHTGGIVAYSTLQPRAAVRAAARILDMYSADADVFLKAVGDPGKKSLQETVMQKPVAMRMIESERKYAELFAVAKDLEGLPRNLTQHAAGIVISRCALADIVPMIDIGADLLVTQFEAKYLEERGLIKMDFLGLRNLSVLDRIVKDIQKEEPMFSLHQIDYNDPKICAVFQRGDTTGIFQFEAEDMKRILRAMKPSCFEDISAANALRRPGASDGIPDFIANRRDPSRIRWLDPSLKDILSETYGIMVYQEQAMMAVQKMAGFSLGKADGLRKAISKKDKSKIAGLERDFMIGCRKNGIAEDRAGRVWQVIAAFGAYGFNKSHSVAYTMISCQLAYLKAEYPLYFYCSLLNGVIGDRPKTAMYIDECRRRGIAVAGPSVSSSQDVFTVEEGKLRMPLTCVEDVGNAAARAVMEVRQERPFTDFNDFASRTDLAGVRKDVLENLIKAGAVDELGLSRTTMLQGLDMVLDYAVLAHVNRNGKTVLDYDLVSPPSLVFYKDRPMENALHEKEVLGFCMHDDAINEVKQRFRIDAPGLAAVVDLIGEEVKSFGLVESVRECTSKNGRKYCRMRVTDGMTEVMVGVWPSDYRNIKDVVKPGLYVLFIGKVNDSGWIQASRLRFYVYNDKK